jgi:hypothetical protein
MVNPSKVDAHREQIRAALATAGWLEPLWLPTTPRTRAAAYRSKPSTPAPRSTSPAAATAR